MKYQLEHLLDECLSQLNIGADLEEVLGQYPEHADELRPALAASAWMRGFAPPPQRRREHKAELLAAVAHRRRLVESVDGMVVELKAGVPLEQLLERVAPDMRPVVLAAHRMKSVPLPMPTVETVQRGKERLMALAASRQVERVAAERGTSMSGMRMAFGNIIDGLRPKPTRGRRLASGAFAAALVISLGLTGTARLSSAAASSLPGDNLYAVKRLGEKAQLMFAFDPVQRNSLQVLFEQRRVREVEALLDGGREVPEDLFERMLNQQAGSIELLNRLSHDQRDLLARLVREVAERDAAVADRLDPQVRDALLTPSRDDLAAGTAVPETTDVGLGWAPRPVPRPLPAEVEEPRLTEESVRSSLLSAQRSPTVAPGANVPTPSGPVDTVGAPAPPVVQNDPGDERRSDYDRGSDGSAATASPPSSAAPGQPTEPGAGGDEPPPIVAPGPGGDGGGDGDAPPVVGPPNMQDPVEDP